MNVHAKLRTCPTAYDPSSEIRKVKTCLVNVWDELWKKIPTELGWFSLTQRVLGSGSTIGGGMISIDIMVCGSMPTYYNPRNSEI